MRIGSLFSGYGGLDQGVQAVLGGTVAWHVDNDPGATAILAHHYPGVPNLGDITAVDWASVEPVDVLTGGFPCQDVSAAGRRAGLAPDTRSGLWAHMARAIAVLQPKMVVIENVRGLLSAKAHRDVEPGTEAVGDGDAQPVLRALGAVLGDLAVLGYDAQWSGLRAADVGAPHSRYRVFIVATVQDANSATGGERRFAAPGQAESRGTRADAGRRGRTPATDTGGEPIGAQPDAESGRGCSSVAGLDQASVTDTDDLGREWSGRVHHGRTRPAERDHAAADTDRSGRGDVDWGAYATAIRQWEHILGRPAPEPTEPGRRGNGVLSPRFVEWLMGLPAGHVTDVPGLSRNAQLKALGNGVVPQQAAAAVSWLIGVTDSRQAAA